MGDHLEYMQAEEPEAIKCDRCGSTEYTIFMVNGMQKVICKNCLAFMGCINDYATEE